MVNYIITSKHCVDTPLVSFNNGLKLPTFACNNQLMGEMLTSDQII